MNTALACDVDACDIRESEYRKTFVGLMLYGNKTSIVAFGLRSRKLCSNENVTIFCPAPPTRCGTTDAEAVSTVHDTKRCVSRRPRGRAKLVCVIYTCTVRSIGI